MLIEVVFASPGAALSRAYRLDEAATVAEALRLAALDPAFAGIDFGRCGLGVYGTIVTPQHVLVEGDRVEIYRELAVDPKNARRRRAAAVRATRRGDGVQ